MELKLATEKAQASLNLIQGQIRAMDQIRTESQHLVKTNAAQARSEIQSLNGQNTSSTHTIYVNKVEQNASGGLVGAGLRVRHFAAGGSVSNAPKPIAFPTMREGTVPGTGDGDGDTVPRGLPAGSFVLRKAAVRRYGADTLRRIESVAKFASGGIVRKSGVDSNPNAKATTIQSSIGSIANRWGNEQANTPKAGFASSISVNTVANDALGKSTEPSIRKKNRRVAETLKLIELGLEGMERYVAVMESSGYGPMEGGVRERTMYPLGLRAAFDRRNLDQLLYTKTLTGNQNTAVEGAEQHWRMAMQTGLRAGVDLERKLIDYMEAEQERQAFYARGGAALGATDTIPAMLTPGEFVVRRQVVDRLGVGFFAQLNALKTPAAALANKVRGFAKGGLVSDSAKSNLGRVFASTPRDLDQLVPTIDKGSVPNFPSETLSPPVPSKTIRVELASGAQKVSATVAASDEGKLLELLKLAQART